MPCHSCQKSSSSPLNFLLNCISCANSWHHRCHLPPVSDKELISIIKAFNAEKHNPAAKLRWQCSICIKAKNAVNQQDRINKSVAVKKATPRQATIPSISPQNAIVIDDDDDEIILLDGPPEVPRRNETTNPGVLSHTDEPQRSSTTQDSFSHPNHQSHTTVSYNQLNTPRVQPPPGRIRTKSKHTRIIDDPFLVPDHSPRASKTSHTHKPQAVSGLTNLSDEEMTAGGDDDALEYITPPPIPASTSKQVVKVVEVPLILSSNQALLHPLPRDARPAAHTSTMTTSPQNPSQLLIQWLNDRSTTAGVKPDLWARACLRRDQNRGSLRDEQRVPSVSPPSRRKSKAYKLNEGSSRATFFLSANGWLREKQATLLLQLHAKT